jgi:hypothetical protein
MDWAAITGASIVAFISGIVGTLIWAWKKIGEERRVSDAAQLEVEKKQHEIDNQAARDEREMDRIRKSDVYKEMSQIAVDIRAQMERERKDCDEKLGRLNTKLDAQETRLTAIQDRERDYQTKIVKLEAGLDAERQKHQSVLDFLERLNVIPVQGAVAGVAVEAAAAAASKIASERIRIHDERQKEQVEQSRRDREKLEAEDSAKEASS